MGYVILYGALLAVGIYFGKRLGNKREDGLFVRWPVGVALGFMFLLLAGQCSSPSAAQTPETNDINVAIQERMGAKASDFPTDFPPDFVRLFDRGVRDGIVDGLRKKGLTIAPNDVALSTTVVNVGRKRILKSKVYVPSKLFWFQFAGVSGLKVMIVVCSSRTAHPFQVEGTDCGATVAKVFGS